MKKLKITSLVLIILLLALGYWILEPFSINPFSEKPVSLVESSSDLKCYTTNQTIKSKADSIINNAVILNDFIGITSAMHSDNCGSWLSTAGFASKKDETNPDKDTKFRIASISKPMTAVAIMQLYERNKIDLDVSIQSYLPEFPKSPKGDITIRQLLKHTSGIQHYASTWDGISFTHYENVVEAIDEFKQRELSFTPGTSYLYTTYGYTILGAIIEKVTNVPYHVYMKENIWIPADMTNTSVELSKVEYENKAELYIKWGSQFIKSPKTDLSVKYPGGGIHSTAEDLIKFGQSILNNSLIDSSTLNLMISSTDTLKEGTPYGFGWFVKKDNNYGRIIEHGGSQSGASSFFQIFLDKRAVVATIANNFNSDNEMYFLARDLSELLLDSMTVNFPVKYFHRQSKAVLKSYEGKYNFEDEILTISRKGNQLFGQTDPYPKVPIYPQSEDCFFYRIFDGQLKFNKIKGLVESVKFTSRRKTKMYKRIK